MNLLTSNTSVYNQLLKIVLPQLKSYKNDLLVHDKAILEDYKGSFLYGHRKNGTDLLRLYPDFKSYKEIFKNNPEETDKSIIECLKVEIDWITGTMGYSNDYFMFYDGTVLKSVTQEEAIAIWMEYVQAIIKNYKDSKF